MMPTGPGAPTHGQMGSLAGLLRVWRERAMLTQQELAERSGVSERTVRRIEAHDGYRPHRASIRALADALELTDDERDRLAAAASETSAHHPASIGGPTATGPIPQQLPRDVLWFAGRDTELRSVLAAAPLPSHESPVSSVSTVVVMTIDGMAGVGKTALAVHAAHRLAGQFPDGQLFIDLHGYTQGVARVEPADALGRLLRELGVAGEQIPAGLDERAALWRTALAGRRMLIVLDNAATEAQVQPLLPGGAGCLVLVTSRRRLAALEATSLVSLDTLSQVDAIALFTRTADRSDLATGTPRSTAELVEVVQLCGRLPLAIQVAAARLRHRRAWKVSDLVIRLRNADARLATLDYGERSVHATLDLSYHHLAGDAQRLYRLLGLHPGPEIGLHAAAALMGDDLDTVRRWLDRLLDDHLLTESAPDRYRFHDLIRIHSAFIASREEIQAQRVAAVDRLLHYYRHTATLAMDAVYPQERSRQPMVSPAAAAAPDLPDQSVAGRWLDDELDNLLAVTVDAVNHNRPEFLWQMSTIVHRHLIDRGRHSDAATLHQHAIDSAREAGDRTAGMNALNSLGHIERIRGHVDQAGEHHQRALRIARDIGVLGGEVQALYGLGSLQWRAGRRDQAAAHFRQALQIARDIGDRVGELSSLNALGLIQWKLGHYEPAGELFQQALHVAQEAGDRSGTLNALNGLADVDTMLGRHERAGEHYLRALEIAQDNGLRVSELFTLISLGTLQRRLGRYERADDYLRHALYIARNVGHRDGELHALNGLGTIHRLLARHRQADAYLKRLFHLAREHRDSNFQYEALQGLGRLYHAIGRPEHALTHHEQALQYATDLAQPVGQARAHDGLAHAYRSLHQHDAAREHWQHALGILVDINTEYTEDLETNVPEIRDHLTRLDQQQASSPQIL